MITAMQKGGDTTFTQEEIMTAVQEATKNFKKLRALVDEEVEKFEKSSEKVSKKKK